MNTKWSDGNIGDACVVGDGAHASIKRQQNGILYLTSKNFKEGGLDLSKVDYILESDYKKYFKVDSKALTKPQVNDVLLSIIGTMGEPYVFKVKDRFGLSSSVAILRPNKSSICPNFLYYWIRGHIFQGALYGVKGGVAQSYVSLEMIRSLPLQYPPIPAQQKIASILSAYDDLIENNTRRIKILEEMAQMLYREWFVNFRFPDYEQVKMVESKLGLIPEGWEVKPIGQVIETIGGGTPSTKNIEYWENGNITWYTPSDLTASKSMFISSGGKAITSLGLQKSSARIFPANSVMMTSRATIGVSAINTEPACTNQGFITCIPNEFLSAYQIYFWIAENKDKISSFASGATFKEISKTVFRQLPILVAQKEIRNQFVKIINPVCKQIENLQRKNINLRKTRDLLLPKLISGEIDIEKLDIDTLDLAA